MSCSILTHLRDYFCWRSGRTRLQGTPGDDFPEKRSSLSSQLLLAQETTPISWKSVCSRNRRTSDEETEKSSKKELELLKPQLRALFERNSERSQATHPPTCTRSCLFIMSRGSESASSPNGTCGSHSSQVAEHSDRSCSVESSDREPETPIFCHHGRGLPVEGWQDHFSYERHRSTPQSSLD